MPYSSVSELPPAVRRKLKGKKLRQWMHVWNSEYDRHHDESRAFASAWSATQKALSHTISKPAADYVDRAPGRDRCGACSMFREPDGCTLVRGSISPRGHCKFFERKRDEMKKAIAVSEGAESFNVFLPITKVEKNADGTCTVSGYASTPSLDLDGEIVSLDAVKKALPGYWEWRNIREMHTTNAVGVAKEANIDEKGLFLTSRIVDKEAVKKCLEEVYKGYSIGGKKLAKSGNTITEIELVEVSIVDRPANPDCRISVAKRAKDAKEAYLVKAFAPRRSPHAKALNKMAQVVEILAKDSRSEVHDDSAMMPEPSATLPKPADAATALCKKHGLANCAKCAMKRARKMAKRDVKESERESLAAQGKALPDKSFPIRNKEDLENARSAFGRSKNKPAARRLIVRRARELGVKLPPSWSKKLAKSLIFEAEQSVLSLSPSAQSSFLTLGAEKSGGVSGTSDSLLLGGDGGSGHEPDVERFALRKGGAPRAPRGLAKSMNTAGSLAYCFDSLRNAQRSLVYEAKREGGDKKDLALAKELGSIAQRVAAVIGQKAEHEGAEALDLTDADDSGLNLEDFAMTVHADPLDKFLAKAVKAPSRAARLANARANLKKARKARGAAEDAIKAAHAMHKAAYIAKMAKAAKGKKLSDDNDADDFDHAGAMSKLQKAYGELEKLGTFVKAANVQLKKAASRSGQRGQEANDPVSGVYQVPAGVKDMSQDEIVRAGPAAGQRGSEPRILGMNMNDSHKAAKKSARGIDPEVVKLMIDKAAAEAKVEALEKLPAPAMGGRKPLAFDVSQTLRAGGSGNENPLFKGVDVSKINGQDENAHKQEVAKVFGNMIVGGIGAKSVIHDPSFHGTAGG